MYPLSGSSRSPARAPRERYVAGAVGAGFFEIVRARPALGRVFRPEEDTPGGKHVVDPERPVLEEPNSAAHPDVIGRTLKLNDEAYTIVGVMPASASVASWAAMACDIWVPMALTDEQRAVRGNHNQQGVARLKPDVDLGSGAVRNGCDLGAARA